jgi:Na+/H+-dicarboxylate symporter
VTKPAPVTPEAPFEVNIATRMALILGIDKFMSECRALTNLIGNGVATVVVSRWEGELDHRDRVAGDRVEGRRQGDEAGPGDARGALRGQHRHYSFNLDGTNIYMTLATLFLAQAVGADLSFGQYAPSRRIFCIMCGSTVSEDEVPSTISNSSLM